MKSLQQLLAIRCDRDSFSIIKETIRSINLGKVLEGHTRSIRYSSFSSDGKYVLTGSDDGTARIWNAETGQCIKILEGHAGWVNSCSFSSDGKYVLTCSDDKTARIWNTETGECLRVLKGHTLGIDFCSFSPDGKYVVTVSNDKTARVWDLVYFNLI